MHEAGHYFMARRFGVKVEEFGFGFPPRIWGKKIGETIYSINLLPIGGFVKMAGEDAAGGGKLELDHNASSDADKGRRFSDKPAWQRAVIVIAGVVMNFLLASVILAYIYGAVGVPTPGDQVIVRSLSESSPARAAGIVEGDRILAIDGIQIHDTATLINIAREKKGQEIILTVVLQSGEEKAIRLTPRTEYPSGEGPMGVGVGPNLIQTVYPWYQAPFVGIWESGKQTIMIIQGIGQTLWQLFTTGAIPQGVAGPVGIAQLTGTVAQEGFVALLSLTALLSLNLAVLNILPIPALDGGRLFFILIEMVIRRPVSTRIEGYAHAAGMILLLGLIVAITFQDIMRLISGTPIIP